ncbi:MAG: holo-[acyl-carrier-protein] synthase [Desulfovibrio piger]|uniref:holo-ACP synthase n=1 Tax=Desulfovibrio piger TaxID=901 RepID=UPI00095EDE66|nr:holo-ACP synthase [Desulfovibrio piger]OLA84653.1 MAG: holo-[acyl-carrier-protein] synthase [Desulfovibrio piger]
MLVGLGMDLTDIGRMERALQRHGTRFAARILAPAEQEACPELRPAFVAGRWAAKEAAVKALGCHIEILPTPTGKPELRFTGPALERARQLGVRHIHVSITHERTTAAAVVVLEA